MDNGLGNSFDVFFSYHWRDHDPVEAVAHMLTERGLRVFLDRWYLTPGQPWPQALERTLVCCNSVAVFLGVDGLGPWQQRERDLALSRQGREPGFPVIPVLLTHKDPALGFLELNTWIDLSSNITDQAELDILCAAIRREPPGPPGQYQTPSIRAEICPYRGLRPFREEDANFFCGREAFTEKLVEAVERCALVAVVGASGSGKSSVVRAGLIPCLRRTNAGRVWEIATLVPTDRPLYSLAAALVPILEPEITRVDRLAEINKLAGHFAEGTVALRDVALDILSMQAGTDRLLLFVDQWEELYTLVADDGERRRFLAEILDASAKGPVTVVLTLRGDFFGQALSDRSFADRLQDAQVNLGPMTQEELERSITEPAEKVGLQFAPGLIERILDDVGQEPGHLPLLEFVLAALWEQRQGITLHHDAYERMGGVEGAIATRADAEFEKLDTAQQDVARHMLIQMVKPGEETEDTRQRAILPTGDATALTVIRRLADARLLVTTRDASSGTETVEVTHEALIHHWTLLRTWVDQDREFLRGKARIDATATLWEKDNRDESRLLAAGRALAEGEEMLTSRRTDLSPRLIAFIEASAAAAARIRRRKFLTRTAALAAMLLAIAGGGLYYYFYHYKHEEYYNAFAKRWGVLEGVGRVSAADAEHRSRTLRFVRKGRRGPVTHVYAIDGSGACARGGIPDAINVNQGLYEVWDDPTRPCSIVWERDSKERVSRQTVLDATGREIFNLVYTGGDGNTAEFRGQEGYVLPMGVATTIRFKRIEEGPNSGQDRLERYTDASGQPKSFIGNAYATQVEYNPQGLIVRAVFLGPDGAPMRNSAGFADLRVRHDKAGSPIEVSLFDESGHPTLAKNGMARWTMTYDRHGNVVKKEYFDEKDSPTRTADGYASIIFAYGPGGKEIKRAFFDEAGKPTLNKEGYAKITWQFDSYGRTVKEAYFDEAAKPTLSKDGYAKLIKQFDKVGNLVEKAFLDQHDKPTRNKDGYAKNSREFDPLGQPTKVAFFDQTGKPTRSKEGYAKIKRDYDSNGQLRNEAYFDGIGQPALSKNGYASITKEYDGAGHLISESYFDEAEKPTLSKEGYAKISIIYDNNGNKTKLAYFDEAGKPTRSKDHYAEITRIYDARGNVVEEAYFDEEGKPCLEKNGVAKTTLWYDGRGNKVKQVFFDENGKPMLSKEGVAKMTSKYDTRGNKIEEAYFDEVGEPTRSTLGLAKQTQVFDSLDRVVEQAFFDETGKPAPYKDGYAKIMVIYDVRGNQIENWYLDEESKPIRSKDGYAKLTQVYDERGNLTEQAYFDESGKPTRSNEGYAKIVQTHDDRGNVVEAAFFDESGKLARLKDGYARLTQIYDERGNLTEQAYFDESGKPMRSKDGYASQKTRYDERGNAVEGSYYDESGHPTLNTDKVSRWTATYDLRGNVISADVFDEAGNPVRLKDGYAKITKAYDNRGNLVEQAYFDEKNNPTRAKDGYAKFTKVYDFRNEVIEQAYFDEKGRPIKGPSGASPSAKLTH